MLIPESPEPRFVMSAEGLRIATYEFGDPAGDPVLLVHGFASSAQANWNLTGWTRDLGRAGRRVIAVDLRGHGESDKPRHPEAYSMDLIAADLFTVCDTYLLDEVAYAGYSLGGRVGWHATHLQPERFTRAVLGGIPDGTPLTRFRIDLAREHAATGEPIDDRITAAYVQMAAQTPGNDLLALIDLVEGMRPGPQPTPGNAPTIPLLLATGSEDGILEASQRLAAAAPNAEFFTIPGRNHFNAPTSRDFREAAIRFLS